ncbi:heat shock protein 40 [Plasmodium falciparum NF54]|uniref:Heat shock protein 40, type II n=3 Tax=Plasmodium falciparum TaxID=5833 RepID=Q8I2E1_PLAF7|nr:heat shock protein 40, type II [Plasmodium falciparum 3D7]EWC91165.1 hypothetical protein PFNF54_00130 [Plasmodium falciparum NF54]KAF4328299.1 heat shock protein 40 [Plasmodium falciparum NF54]PKC48008.1 heat shock protein 40 [Plasmodium falciparum NF54]CAD48948.1 heat shock protein 40, type II [Plasmodium falciparum 3D7]|eukprot:XP_001351062.1 heat shock protein 40, type II [Plasmodium falciparum 3D7]
MATLRKSYVPEILYFSKFFMNACFISLLIITVNCFNYENFVCKDKGIYNEKIVIRYKRCLAEGNKNFFFNKDNGVFGKSSMDYYTLLGVDKGCSEDDLRRAYLKLAMKWHPDKHVNKGSKVEAEEKFKNICEAYSVLSDNEKRVKYDLFGMDALKQSGFNSSNFQGNISINPLEVFTKAYSFYNKYFSKSSGAGNHNIFTHIKNLYPLRNDFSEDESSYNDVEEYEVPLYVTLEDLYNGCTKTLKVTRKRYDGCYLYYEDYFINVDIKQGWNNGTKITFHGEGDQSSPDSYPGDLVLVLQTKKHSKFVRKSRDLYYRHIITLEQSLTGFDFVIKSLDNRDIHIQIDEVVKPDTKKVIKNEGMPYSRDPSIRGNLIVEFDIIYPNTIKKEQKKLIKEIFKESY